MANRVKLQPIIGAEIPYKDYTAMIGDTTNNSALLRSDADPGKALKLLADSRFGFCADGDEIAAQLQTVEPDATSAGYRIGTVRFWRDGSILQGKVSTSTALVIGDEVVAGAQAAYGVANNAAPYNLVMNVKKAAEPNGLRLRVVSFAGANGNQNSIVNLAWY